ncbi:hypothetical protein O181_038463 [Austropuccinia psidii MF-1]|uniref:Uncharacterized protein n=1 Tax=Austropuccinia psidii MF-1 TaxID=1389203 RepID=A0A9Q3DDE1_9BASI|nr:hypothetical protein [Austropuccinia psidii MF-1]
MPLHNSPAARQTRSQAQAQAVLTPTPRAPLDGTPAVSPLMAQLDRVPIKEGAAPTRKEGRVPRRSRSFSGVEESDGTEAAPAPMGASDGTEAAPAPVGASEGTRGPTLAQSDQPVSHQT